MKINWKLRLTNKVTLSAIVAGCLDLIYQILAAAGIAPAVDESVIWSIAETAIGILCLVGIVVDPTTAGASDSEQALSYIAPGIGNVGGEGDFTSETLQEAGDPKDAEVE